MMTLQPLALTLWTLSLWTPVLGSIPILQRENVSHEYPEILSTAAIVCNCASFPCNFVHWFHIKPTEDTVEFLTKCNTADRCSFPAHPDRDKERFRSISKKDVSFTLRILNVTEQDAGVYSCVVSDKPMDGTEMWRPGTHLHPGVPRPTLPPKPESKPAKPCNCPKKKPPRVGCGSMVLWPLVGFITALALALICALYYFSRLPKKCRHHFVKKR